MYFTQVGQIGTPVIVAKKAQLPTPNAANMGRYYITTYDPADSTDYPKGTVLTVKQDGDTYSLVAVFQMPTMTNPIESAADVIKDKQAVNNKGQLVTGTFATAEKTIESNGTFYPADDGVNAYSKVTVNVAGETAENPYIATTDAEMAAYLAAEYKDSFVRMDYAKYRMTLPATATTTTAILKCTSIGIPRMCSYIDKWLGGDSEKVILNLQGVTIGVAVDCLFKVYKKLNADNTYGYLFGLYAGSAGLTTMFAYNVVDGTIVDGYTFNSDDFLVSSGWLSDSSGTFVDQVNQIITTYLGSSGSYTVAIDDALVLTNMAGSEADNTYIEGGVYKVATKYVENNNYVAESPFAVGDALSGATFYINQQLTYEEFITMFNTVPSDEFNSLPTYSFLNYDNPYEISDMQGYAALIPPALISSDGEGLIAYGASLDNPFIFDPNMQPTDKASLASFVMAASIEIGGETINTPATITKINRPDIFNAIFGKTANFTKQSTIETKYVFDLQLSNGSFEEAQSETKLDAKATNDNIGKIYQYTGATGNKYENQSLYIIMGD